jgi:hypothetical protein
VRAGAGEGERRDEGGGVREAVGMQTPRGCAGGGDLLHFAAAVAAPVGVPLGAAK